MTRDPSFNKHAIHMNMSLLQQERYNNNKEFLHAFARGAFS